MNARTDPDELFETLLTEGLFEEEDEDLRLSDEFVDARERFREEVGAAEESDRLSEYVGETSFSVDDVDERTVADAMAVRETCETIDREASVHVALSLNRSEMVEEESHVPSGFVSLAGEEIESFLRAHPASIIYCWRKDCAPCRAVRDHLEDLRSDGEIPEAIGLGAVYGPDNAEILTEEYDIGGSPTTLFCSGTTVETRFLGNPGPNGLRREIEALEDNL